MGLGVVDTDIVGVVVGADVSESVSAVDDVVVGPNINIVLEQMLAHLMS